MLLFLVTSSVPGVDAAARSAGRAHLTGFLTLTLPVVTAFALLEASRWRATWGKRLLGLEVRRPPGGRASFARTFVRNGGKFLPWEMSHLVIHRVPGWPADPAPLAPWQLAVLAGAYLLVLLFVVGTFRGRTPYDALAGVRVVHRSRPT